MIDRDFRGGPIYLRCDAFAPEYCETGEHLFNQAIAVAQHKGWTVRHLGAERGWAHFCPDCTADKAWERDGAVRPALGRGRR